MHIYPWCLKGPMPGQGSNFKAAFFRRLRRATRLNYVGEGFPFQLTAVNIVLHAPIRTSTYLCTYMNTNSILAMRRHRSLPAYKESVVRVLQLQLEQA